ncbi:ATP synthase subunit I [uncultured Desulfosarcina sp.]|uniref:ATP synthase subunit I n=1 Tax=uncultured Desulfosarcina sp. TaxID=218289 RepID=UPI0029C7B607|nr:ATP synthase subunit I [uncultured Desulfosarcina sp.]
MDVDATRWTMAFLWGGLLGFCYFGGLWLTLKKILEKRWPQRWLGVSLLVRLTVALTGFWAAVRTDAGAFFFTVGGFFLVRIVLTRMIESKSGGRHHAAHS